MKNSNFQPILAGIAEEAIPSSEIDLWKGVCRRLESGETMVPKRGVLMKLNLFQTFVARRVVVIVLAFIFAFAILLVTPQGRAWAQEIIQFFIRATGDTMPAPTLAPLIWVDVTPSVPFPTNTPGAVFTDCGDFNNPKCSVEQIRKKVNFPVMELGAIPEGMHFVGATGGPERIALTYAIGKYGYGLFITEEPWTGNSELMQWKIGADAIVETVQIGNVSGEYVRGAFVVPAAGGTNQIWDVDAGIQTLRWINNGTFFSMQENVPPGMLDKTGFIALADNLTAEPVSTRLIPIPVTQTPVPLITYNGDVYNLSASEAGEQAGFKVLEPKRLPKILSFTGISYKPEQNIVRIFYIEPQFFASNTFGLRVSEELLLNGGGCNLCGIIVGDYGDFLKSQSGMVVGVDAIIEKVKIDDNTIGQYVEGIWAQSNSGWAWLPYPEIKTLRWQSNGMAFELQYSGFRINNEVPISKADLISIAKNIK